jgi:PmbA protein
MNKSTTRLNPKKRYLQVALNGTLEDAHEIIKSLPGSDRIIIEAGTPLIKRYGENASRLFDRECVATKPRTLVNCGVIYMWHTTIESAAKLGIIPTGHGSGASNLTLLPGLASPQSLMRGISRGLLVTELMGHGANMVTGDYSIGVEGFLIENGEVTSPVSGVTIAGNLLEMWKTMVPADDLSKDAGTNAPSLLVEQMTVGGSS